MNEGLNLDTSLMASDEERVYAGWMHMAGLSGYIIPFGNFLAPLILWLIRRRESVYIDQQGKEVMNFQLSIIFYGIFTSILVWLFIGWLFVPVVFLLHLLGTIVGAVRTWSGQSFRYPATFRVIR